MSTITATAATVMPNTETKTEEGKGVSAAAHCSANWTAATVMPGHTKWVLIVIDGRRGLPDHVGLGWRKRDPDGRATGWWETSHGLMNDSCIKFWAETPPLPNAKMRDGMGEEKL
jgi:hypothetical protein